MLLASIFAPIIVVAVVTVVAVVLLVVAPIAVAVVSAFVAAIAAASLRFEVVRCSRSFLIFFQYCSPKCYESLSN